MSKQYVKATCCARGQPEPCAARGQPEPYAARGGDGCQGVDELGVGVGAWWGGVGLQYKVLIYNGCVMYLCWGLILIELHEVCSSVFGFVGFVGMC